MDFSAGLGTLPGWDDPRDVSVAQRLAGRFEGPDRAYPVLWRNRQKRSDPLRATSSESGHELGAGR